MPRGVDRMVDGLLSTGRSAMVTSATHRRRAELGLPELPEVDVEVLKVLLEGHPAPQQDDQSNDGRKEKP